MSLPPEVRAKYVTIIDSILEGADLTTITAGSVRKGIQERVEYDITPQKAAIKQLINERFDIINAKKNKAETAVVPSVEPAEPADADDADDAEEPAPAPKTNGVHKPEPQSASSSPVKRQGTEDLSDVVDTPPPKKKRKPGVDADAALAAKLQAEEDLMARPTRGGASRKTATVKKKKRTKKERVTASDDSDVDGEDKKKPKRDTGFHKPLNLSPALSALLDGETQLSRPETTKRLWAYIKSHELQDPSDKRYIFCDSRMREVFRQDRVHMFQMTKLVSQQMYNPDE